MTEQGMRISRRGEGVESLSKSYTAKHIIFPPVACPFMERDCQEETKAARNS